MRLILFATLLALGACGMPEGPDRPGTWRAGQVNDANLRAMLAPPADPARAMPADRASSPVTRLIAGERPALPDAGRARMGGSSDAAR